MAVACQSCKARPAKIHYTEIVNNNMVTIDLCLDCAEEKGLDVQNEGNYGMGDLIAGLIDTTVESESEKIGQGRCSGCGYEYSDFKRIGRFGCSLCYEAFSTQLIPLLRHVHGSTQHAGKRPPGDVPGVSTIQKVMSLREDLEAAIKAEEYERAASIRDEIRRIESGETPE